jgi:uncharacterized protein DUF4150
MGKNVFANGNEVSAKKDDNKSIAAMADVCLSPPSPPAGPVPIPYPNTAVASDTSNGSKTVKIGGDEVGLKNASDYKKSNGDEAATKSLGMGVVSHNIQGKMKHAAWSMDVKFEGKNAIRHMDLTTHNHMNADNVALVMDGASVVPAVDSEVCEELDRQNQAEIAKIPPDKLKAKKAKPNGGWAISTAKIDGSPATDGIWHAASDRDLIPKGSSSSFKTDHMKGPTPDCAGIKGEGGGAKNWTERGKDSEAKLLGPLMASPNPQGIKITLKVYHEYNATPGKPDSLPCWSCREAICGAEKCGIEVTLCTNQNKAVKAKDMCEDGEPKPKGADNGDKVPPPAGSKSEFWSKAGFGPR